MVPTICPTGRVIHTTHTHIEGHGRANRQVGLLPGVALVTRQRPLDGAWQGAVGGLVDIERPYADTVHVVPEGEAVDWVSSQRQAFAEEPGFVTSVARLTGLNEGIVAWQDQKDSEKKKKK